VILVAPVKPVMVFDEEGDGERAQRAKVAASLMMSAIKHSSHRHRAATTVASRH
jgi:hypothetical protein